MNIKSAEKLLKLFNEGYVISYASGYVDCRCRLSINKEGEIMLCSGIFSGLELSGLAEYDFTVSEDLDNWQDHTF